MYDNVVRLCMMLSMYDDDYDDVWQCAMYDVWCMMIVYDDA